MSSWTGAWPSALTTAEYTRRAITIVWLFEGKIEKYASNLMNFSIYLKQMNKQSIVTKLTNLFYCVL